MNDLRRVLRFGASVVVAILALGAMASPLAAQGSGGYVPPPTPPPPPEPPFPPGYELQMRPGWKDPVAGEIKRADNPGNVVFQIVVSHTTMPPSPPGTLVDTISEIKFANIGSATATDIESYKLWTDTNGDGAPDSQLAVCPPSNLTFGGLNIAVNASSILHLIVTADVALKAVNHRTVQIEIKKEDVTLSSLKVEYPDSIASQVHEVADALATLNFSNGPQVSDGIVHRGAMAVPVMQLLFAADADGRPAIVQSIATVAAVGNTAQYSDIVRMRLFREVGTANGLVDGLDVQVGGDATIAGGFDYLFSGLAVNPVAAGTTATYLIVADIAASATIGAVVKFTVQRAAVTIDGSWNAAAPMQVTGSNRTIASLFAQSLNVESTPAEATAGAALSTIVVRAQLGDGSPDTGFFGQVTALVFSGPVGVFTSTSTVSVLADAGEATFTNLFLTTSGTYRLRFVSAPVPFTAGAVTDFFQVVAAAPSRLFIASQPQTGQVGAALPPPPVVHVLDVYGNVATSFAGNVSAMLVSNPGSSTLTGGVVAAENGVATFSNLQLNRVAAGYTLRFSAASLIDSPASLPFSVAIGDPAAIVILQQPQNTTGGDAMVIDPRVQVVDVAGNVITSYGVNIDVAIANNPGSGTLSGTVSKTPAAGEVTFFGLIIDKAGLGYTLHFTSGALIAVSGSFDVYVGPATRLGVVQQPANSTGGIALPMQPVIHVQDNGGNLIVGDTTSIIEVSITAGSGDAGAMLSGGLIVSVAGGVASFSNLAINVASATPYTLTFVTTTLPAYTPTTSASFIISVGPAARVGLVTQPGLATMAVPFVQQPVAQIQDFGGNLIAGSSALVTAMLSVSPPGAALQGTATTSATGGVASFAGLSVTSPGLGFVLLFESPGLVPISSTPFNIASTATKLAVVVQPGTAVIDVSLGIQPAVEVQDALGVVVSADNFTTVTAEIVPGTGGGGAALTGDTTVVVVNGRATFTNLGISLQGLGYQLRFTCFPALTLANSTNFNVVGAAARLMIVRQPLGASAGEPLAAQPKIVIVDSNNLPVFDDNTTVITASITPGTGSTSASLSGTLSMTTVAGVADFTDLRIDWPGMSYRLSFGAVPVVQQAVSSSFSITGSAPADDDGGPASVGGGGGCSSCGGGAPWLLAAVLGLLALLGIARRRASYNAVSEP
ncbi:MAG: hypothetical protein IT462_11735 [Planctomycetes bacterium]|nr:hypothetical protein [Planctomycetota bacterium]